MPRTGLFGILRDDWSQVILETKLRALSIHAFDRIFDFFTEIESIGPN